VTSGNHLFIFLLQALQKLPNMQIQVYRGLSSPLTKLSSQYKAGNKVVWVAFTSTTKNKETMKQFSENNVSGGTWMIIDIIEGKDISTFSLFSEEEVLLMPNACFTVQDVVSEQIKRLTDIPSNLDVMHLIQKPTPKEDCLMFSVVVGTDTLKIRALEEKLAMLEMKNAQLEAVERTLEETNSRLQTEIKKVSRLENEKHVLEEKKSQLEAVDSTLIFCLFFIVCFFFVL